MKGTFHACIAERTEDPGARALAAAARANDPQSALDLYGDATKSESAHVRLEARLGRADIHISSGNGDAACRELFAARDAAPNIRDRRSGSRTSR